MSPDRWKPEYAPAMSEDRQRVVAEFRNVSKSFG